MVLNRVAPGASFVALGTLCLSLRLMEMLTFADGPVVKQAGEKPCGVLVQGSALVQKLKEVCSKAGGSTVILSPVYPDGVAGLLFLRGQGGGREYIALQPPARRRDWLANGCFLWALGPPGR